MLSNFQYISLTLVLSAKEARIFIPYPPKSTIANFFSNIGRVDELGSGVRNLYKYAKIYSGGETFLFEDDVFRIKVPIYEKPINVV